MAKEKLRFRVNGKSIVYEGHPENRGKDLMDILAKLNVTDEVALSSFRENIENEADFSDSGVMSMFQEAKQARAEKNKAKGGSAAPAAPAAAPPAQEEEQKQKITLVCRGKQFSYTGLLSAKKSAVVQLLCKQKDITRDEAIEVFRTNLPDEKESDDDIWNLVQNKQSAKTKSKHADASSAPASSSAAAAAAAPSSDAYDALDELDGMSAKERNELNDFIRQVLEQPTTDVAALLRNEPRPRAEAEENAELALTQRTSGKIPVYLQDERVPGTKLIHATPTMTYDEFASIVEKKFGEPLVLSFYEGDDIIELDDDDVLAMFLEMCMQGDGKKNKLICSKPGTRKAVAEDQLTVSKPISGGSAQITTTKAKSFSNGELTVKELKTYTGHSMAVYCCAFNIKGDMFVTASRDRSVRVWNVQSGSCTTMKGGHNGFVLCCDYSPKNNRVVSSSDDHTIKIWNVSNAAKVATLKGHEDKVYCVKYNSTGEYIASASCDHMVRVWNAESYSKMTTLKGHTLAVFTCAFSNTDKGKYVVSGSDDRLVKIWDWSAGKEVNSLVGHIGTVWSVAFSNSDKYVVSGSMDYELMLWSVESGKKLRSFEGHKTSIHHAIFSKDDRYILSCARDWSVMVWDTEEGTHVETITGHGSTVYHVDMKNDRLLTSSLDDTLKLWSITRNE